MKHNHDGHDHERLVEQPADCFLDEQQSFNYDIIMYITNRP